MERSAQRIRQPHVLLVPYPVQGHINPMLQFAKRLASHGVTTTIAITRYLAKSSTQNPNQSSLVRVEHISDGYDEGGFKDAESTQAYLERFKTVGSKSLVELVHDLEEDDQGRSPVDCVVYDPFLPWALDVAKDLGLFGAAFFTQTCVVCAIYHHAHKGNLAVPVQDPVVFVEGLPLPLGTADVPPFLTVPGHYPASKELMVGQFSNLEKADMVFFNTFYELEAQVVDWMATMWPMRTIGPTIPSLYLDKRVEGDGHYGFDLYSSNNNLFMNWLDSKQTGSVVYTAFGSMAALELEQMEEIAWGLRGSNKNFLWVVREEEESKLPNNFIQETGEKGLVAKWCAQLEVLAHRAVGCFVTHCGWNSTTEALSLGVPMVGVPQWTDQPTNAKFVQDVWGVGVRAKVDGKGIVRREEMESCIREVMEGERAEEMKQNAKKWKDLAREAVSEGGSSNRNIQEFIAKVTTNI